MGEREWWANVYAKEDGTLFAGFPATSRSDSTYFCMTERAKFRIHVRLKPEGAPKRYASADERWSWEAFPNHARRGVVMRP